MIQKPEETFPAPETAAQNPSPENHLPSTILSRIDFYQTLPLQMCMSMVHQACVITAAHLQGRRRLDVTGAELALCWLSVILILNCCWVGVHD